MSKQIVYLVLALGLVFAFTATTEAAEWAVKADYAESCSCNPSCPCVFGSPATLGHCDGANVVKIDKGHYGDVNLDGLTVVSAFSVGKWVKYSIDEGASKKQVAAIEQLMPEMFGYHKTAKVLSSGKASVSADWTATNVKYSSPSTNVELEMMKGHDGGPIIVGNVPIHGFPAPQIVDAQQFKSVTLTHQAADKEYSYAGTNGFVGRLDASGGK